MLKIQQAQLVVPQNCFTAIYRPAALPEHAGNPLLEALPPFRQSHELIDAFGRFPHIAEEERQLPAYMRMMAVSRINNYLEPLPAHGSVIDNVGLIIRSGYVNRNPSNQEYQKALKQFYREAMDGKPQPLGGSTAPNAPSFALFGVSGVGKSTVVERSLSFLPQVLHHNRYNFSQVSWIKLDCPLDGSLKQLLFDMLREFDTLLGTNYANQIKNKKTTTIDEVIASVAAVALSHHLGIFVIDEIQHLLDSSGIGQAKMLNFFVYFTNKVKIPMLTVGTPRALHLLTGTFREARRIGDNGAIIWDSLSFDEEWDFFLDGLWKYQWTANMVPLTNKLSSLIYEKTQGIHALVVRLFQLSQLQAISNGDDRLSPKLIEQVAHDKFKLVAPMIDALRKGDQTAIDKYEDLLINGLKEIGKAVDKDIKLALLREESRKRNQASAHFLHTVSALVVMGLEQAQAQDLADIYFKANPGKTCNDAVKTILEMLETGDEPRVLKENSLAQLVKSADPASGPINKLIAKGLIASINKSR